MLNLLHLGSGRERDLVVTDLLGRPEKHGAHAVERVFRAGAGHHGAEPADGQHCGSGGADDAESAVATPGRDDGGRRAPVATRATALLAQTGIEGGNRVGFGDQSGLRGPARLVPPAAEQGRKFSVGRVLRCHRTTTGQGVDEGVGAADGLHRRLLGTPRSGSTEIGPTEIRHSPPPIRRFRT